MIVVEPPATITAPTPPLFMSTVAVAGVALVQAPPETEFVNVVTVPVHPLNKPVTDPIAAGWEMTVTARVA